MWNFLMLSYIKGKSCVYLLRRGWVVVDVERVLEIFGVC